MLTFHFSGAEGKMTEEEILTSGMVGKTAKLEFTDDWDGLRKTVVFTAGKVTRDVVDAADTVTIPAEVLAQPLHHLWVGVYGVSADGTRVIPTIRALGPGILPGVDPSGDEGTDPTLPIWAQLQQMIGNLQSAAVPWITPETYGAVGDGATDDSAAIQAAIDAAGSDAVVYLEKKTYLITTGLVIESSHATLRCEGELVYTGNDAAVTVKAASVVLDINVIRSSGVGLLMDSTDAYVGKCTININRIASSTIGLKLYTNGQSMTYNKIRIADMDASEIGVLAHADGSYINENYFYMGRIGGGPAKGIRLYGNPDSTATYHETTRNVFFSGSCEGIADDGVAIELDNTSSNVFRDIRCAENYGTYSVRMIGACHTNVIELSRLYLGEIDYTQLDASSRSNVLKSQAITTGRMSSGGGYNAGYEVHLDGKYGITYDPYYSKREFAATAGNFPDQVIEAFTVGDYYEIPSSVVFDDASQDGTTWTIGALWSEYGSAVRGAALVAVFGAAAGLVKLADCNGQAILDNTAGAYAGQAVSIRWNGYDAGNARNIWLVQNIDDPFATEGYVTEKLRALNNGDNIVLESPGGNAYRLVVTDGGHITAMPAGTSLVPSAIDTDGSIYNGTGYKADTRLNSSGAEVAASGAIVSGYIPFTLGDTIVASGSTAEAIGTGGHYIAFYDADFSLIRVDTFSNASAFFQAVYEEAGIGIYGVTVQTDAPTVDISSAAYFRVSMGSCAAGDFEITLDSQADITPVVESVNGKTGKVVLAAGDLDAYTKQETLDAIASYIDEAILGGAW